MMKKKQWTLKLNMTQDTNAKKSRSKNKIMKVVQLVDEPLLPTPCRIKK